MNIELILASALFAIIGIAVGFFIRSRIALAELKNRQGRADEIVMRAKNEANDLKVKARKEAKEYALEEKEKIEKEFKSKEIELKDQEKNLVRKEAMLEDKIEKADKELKRIEEKEKTIENGQKELEQEKQKLIARQGELTEQLTKIAQMSKEDAKNELVKMMESEARHDFAKILKQMDEDAKESAEKNAKKHIGTAMQRFAGEYVAEQTITSVELPSDDIKGRLIGREGRNIRAFEQICGVDLIIDDTPEIVVVSSFNVVRREIAKMTIEKLIADGRIHPAKIEELHEKSRKEMELHLRDLGEKAQMEIGVHGIHPEILKLVGALSYRTSYTQNQYQHALECAILCGSMAAELGLNVKQARRAALLHDVGKVLDASAEGSHAVIGSNFLKKYGESPDIVHAVRAHHDDEKPESILAHLVAAADALSGARPGARKAMMESYVSRLTDIEQIVNSFEGVSNSYAISGGREVRVLVANEKVSDEQTVMLSRDIAKKIENEMSYPGTIKVTVIRETKAVGVAK